MLRLEDGSGEAVQQVTVCAVFLADPVFHQVAHQLVGDEQALVHIFLGLFAQRSAFLDVRAEDVSGGDVQNVVFFSDSRRLGAFAGSRRSKQYNALHRVPPTLRNRCSFS